MSSSHSAPTTDQVSGGSVVYEERVPQNGTTVNISPRATRCRYRLVDCAQFRDKEIIRILEFSEFPPIAYTAISYVWRGNKLKDQSSRVFTVKGAEDADPIGVDALKHACAAAIQRNTNFLWLDRLCIIQTVEEDKSWQIRQMYEVYKRCTHCIVLPGGLGRLVSLGEETDWAQRAWTLQEALAPPHVSVLFAWKLGSGNCPAGDQAYDGSHWIDEVAPKVSALAPLAAILNGCVIGHIDFDRRMYFDRGGSGGTPIHTRIFGSAESSNARALAAAMSEVQEPHIVWQCALMRTSSRPVDMVLSIMGVFGVTLDPVRFKKATRLEATIALAKEILKKGGSASWLGAAIRLPPCKLLSTFPIFPSTHVAGRALFHLEDGAIVDAASMVDGEYHNDLPLKRSMPTGKMDDDGYLTFSSLAIPLSSSNADQDTLSRIQDISGATWYLPSPTAPSQSFVPSGYAVCIGWFQKYYPFGSLANGVSIKAMVIQEHAPERFHVSSYLVFDSRLRSWIQRAWKEQKFCVGGSGPETIAPQNQSINPWYSPRLAMLNGKDYYC